MVKRISVLLLFTALSVVLLSAYSTKKKTRILVFSKTTGYRHASITVGKKALIELGASQDFSVDTTEDASAFTFKNLKQYDVILFLSTTGNVLDSAQQSAFEKFIRSGKGFVGIHAATDTEYDWPWYLPEGPQLPPDGSFAL